ncbi:hypothetical protein HOLleu_08296 [Holothuria leucospilota]|uniref:TMEM87A/B GOLD domain-containing protein n=1 Tax=Holothuria leucospilota TaxID=206669 RepID=A0A9Q1CHC2_HOLLE|nr:hypothetical protein HOLleu_08296 [Holothuria leucospilota]
MAGPFRGTDLRFPIFMFLGLLAFIHDATCGRLEPGIEKFKLATSNYSKGMPVFAIRAIKKSMFKNTPVKITITDEKVFCNTSFAVAWELRYTRCAQLYTAKSEDLFIQDLMMDPSFMYSVEPEISVIRNGTDFYTCSDVTSSAIHPQFPPSNTTTCYVPRKSSQHANCEEVRNSNTCICEAIFEKPFSLLVYGTVAHPCLLCETW